MASQGLVDNSESNDPATLGAKIRQSRLERGLGVRELARVLECSPSLISQIERDKANPSVNTLYSIANVLGISVDSMFATRSSDGTVVVAGAGAMPRSIERPVATPITVQRQDSRLAINLDHGVRWELLTPTPEHNNEFMEVTYPPGSSSAGDDEFVRHSGREYAMVLDGELSARIGDETFVVGPGDSLSFDPTTPHRFWNDGSGSVRAVWFVQDRWTPGD